MGSTAVVVGGGIGGLAAAIGLRRLGWDVTVVERAATLEDAGAGISLAANGLRALDALGVGAAVRDASRGQYSGGTRTPRGGWLTRMDGAALERAVGTPIMGIPRATLHRLLRASLPARALLTGAEAVTVEQTGPGTVRVGCGDRLLEAGLVVAADGIGSKVRRRLFPDHPGPVYSGSTVLRAITEHAVDPRTDFELTWGRGAEFGHIAFLDGRAEWHAVLSVPAGTRYADPLAELRRRFHAWHDPIPALLDATRPEDVLHHDVNELRTPLPSYTAGRIALLGDAAHAMTPNLGQGACQALEDAVTLAAALGTEPTVEAALVRYDAERRPRSQAVARAARQAGTMGQRLSHPLAVALRNTAMRLTPSRAATRMILRHHAWVSPRLD
ncbi:FAD-dependent oxidoreductase [Streptomyces eurocidicus]|uniref:FAD-dependent oxidoreductase n=1 Tax=Streptomyces eurocidicus TaxID=66423 RepID=A0A2N8NX17_STREU|nr:FAD-dependent monooxygenase [Streptomyces eurocidicus]MBB5117861.1 2-polyprenyl-6-methoxyphenol hydroxylase-like FAD-dependent oxidoreductase [Streptomyces eurocidicus]MBF6056360.1 NAD(P)-binding protein [Streptomyces eurocidicus]PNE33318.1 FAD-dependent oxidoreductase [Streptomyces eurocidicus]